MNTTNIPPVNHVELDRSRLVAVLEYLGYRIGERFSHSVRLIVHGGACMLLHPGLYNLAQQQARMTPGMRIRTTTRDVDYIHRAFVGESMAYGEPEAPYKLLSCIRETAMRFGLGADWMNSAADVALPMTTDPTGRQVDPIYTASIQKSNIECHTIFSSANGMLKLVSVAPFWAISLKLVRYLKWDPSDICILLKYGTILSPGSGWTRENLERWLRTYCWSMGYANYPPEKKTELRGRIKHAINLVNTHFAKTPTLQEFSATGFRTDTTHASRDLIMGTEGLDSSKAEWGGGDRTGWQASFAGDWIKPNDAPTKSATPLPHTFPQFPQNTLLQNSINPNTTPPSLSPLFAPHTTSPLPTTGSPSSRPKISSNVADWIAEKQRDQQREQEGRKEEQKRESQQEVTTPFIPTLPQGFEHSSRHRRSQTDNALGLLHGQSPPPGRPTLERRAYSQPVPAPPQSYSHTHGPYYYTHTTTQPQCSTSYPTPPIHGPSVYTHPQDHIPPYPTPTPQVFYHSSPPTKVKVKIERRKNGKARDKARGKARSAKRWRQTHSMMADGTFLVNLWREEEPDSEDDVDEDENPTPESTPMQSSSPVIYPLTTVVYYNQYQEQQRQQQQQQQLSTLIAYPTSPKPSPPLTGQMYTQSPTLGGQPWTPHPTMVVPHMSSTPHHHHTQVSTTTHMPLSNPDAPTYSQPVIPPQEYMKHDRSTGALQKLMSALKI